MSRCRWGADPRLAEMPWRMAVRVGHRLLRAAQRGASWEVLAADGAAPGPGAADPMPLDRPVIPLASRLWALGLPTTASCAGHWDGDHMTSGFVAVRCITPRQWRLLRRLFDLWFRDGLAIPPGVIVALERSGAYWAAEHDVLPGPAQTVAIVVRNGQRERRRAEHVQHETWRRLARAIDRSMDGRS